MTEIRINPPKGASKFVVDSLKKNTWYEITHVQKLLQDHFKTDVSFTTTRTLMVDLRRHRVFNLAYEVSKDNKVRIHAQDTKQLEAGFNEVQKLLTQIKEECKKSMAHFNPTYIAGLAIEIERLIQKEDK